MKEFKMEVDVTATAYITVEAENEEEAMELAMNEVAQMHVEELKNWETTATVKDSKYQWTCSDLDKWEKVWPASDYYIDEDDVNLAIENEDIIFISKDRQGAYEAFINDGFAEINELKANGIDTTFEWFCSELDKGYHESGSIEIARLIETSNGIFYDKEYC